MSENSCAWLRRMKETLTDCRQMLLGCLMAVASLLVAGSAAAQQYVGTPELLHKIVEERGGAAVGMRLEDQDRALVIELFHRVQQGFQLTGVMRIIIVNIRSVVLSFELKASSSSAEAGKPIFHGIRADTQAYGGRCRCQSVFHIVLSGNMELNISEEPSVVHDVEAAV